MGHTEEAKTANAHALKMFEELVEQFPGVAEYRFQLVETYVMADPWADEPSSLASTEQQLRQAQGLIDQLAVESPDNSDYIQAQVLVQAKLGAAFATTEAGRRGRGVLPSSDRPGRGAAQGLA